MVDTMPGCCSDRDGNHCTAETCMKLPGEATCGDCIHVERCCAIFGHTPEDTRCDWFPRKFRLRRKD